jgi:hypothetical protein
MKTSAAGCFIPCPATTTGAARGFDLAVVSPGASLSRLDLGYARGRALTLAVVHICVF